MIEIDTVMEILRDGRWYGSEEIKKQISLPNKKTANILRFLREEALIEEEKGKVRLAPRGVKLLQLPA